ncbi:uncharacterized protein LTR77_004622 [Saxophila tyrrhenica]|uniref:Alpha/beta hydrolase fold-3 domain-containing protein n=1 Tax=Saxophila tyrrhenica TaxID=1690608 RepID=A0AAV9PGN8_9PEZI|nr:hypothetical protein LTR77_004622 [Saxophila tyrrhenica]
MDFTSLTPQQVLELAKPSKEFEEVLRTYQAPGLDWSKAAKALAILRHYVGSAVQADQADPEVEQETLHAPARDGTMLPLKVFRPANAREEAASCPLIVLFFAGGFIMGDPMTLAPLARSLVKRFNAVVVAPTHRLAPEHPFPVAIEDSWDSLSWIAHNVGTIGADAARGFILGGLSSGGNVANSVAHLARDNNLQPPLTRVWFSCAGVRIAPSNAHLLPEVYRERNLSRSQNECVDSVTTSAGMEQFKRDALKADLDSRLIAPMIWSDEAGLGHKGFPKTYSQVAGIDTARDEALIFDDILKEGRHTDPPGCLFGSATLLLLYFQGSARVQAVGARHPGRLCVAAR